VHKPDDVPLLIRRTHEERILATLREVGPLTRAELEARTGLSRTTLSDITAALLRRGALVALDPESGPRGRGRPAARLALDPASGQFLGVDFGHRRAHVAIVNAANEVIVSGGRAYDVETSWEDRVDLALAIIDELTGAAGVHLTAVEGIGIGVPGPVTAPFSDDSRVPSRWRELGRDEVLELVRSRFAARFPAPITLDNNSRFAGLGEAIWGPSPSGGNDSLLFIRLSDGVGGGLVVGGRLVSGALGIAGEVGHVTVDPAGERCWCGKRGCLETVASAPSVRARIAAATGDPDDVEHPAARAVIARAGEATGRVLATVTTVVDPSEIVVAGDMLRMPGFLDAVRAAFEAETLLPAERRSRFRVSALSEEAGALGAIAAAFHRSPLLVGYGSLIGPTDSPAPERRQA
jgi:predicted NBD/HSP70 family sugar kinase